MNDQARAARMNANQAVNQLAKANVGYNYAVHALDKGDLKNAHEVAHGGSDAEDIVLSALRFTFAHESQFTEWLAYTAHYNRGMYEEALEALTSP